VNNELEVLDKLYKDFRTATLSIDPLITKLEKEFPNGSVKMELILRLKKVQVENMVTLELLSDLASCSDLGEMESVRCEYSGND
jgi:hypothetical protein